MWGPHHLSHRPWVTTWQRNDFLKPLELKRDGAGLLVSWPLVQSLGLPWATVLWPRHSSLYSWCLPVSRTQSPEAHSSSQCPKHHLISKAILWVRTRTLLCKTKWVCTEIMKYFLIASKDATSYTVTNTPFLRGLPGYSCLYGTHTHHLARDCSKMGVLGKSQPQILKWAPKLV